MSYVSRLIHTRHVVAQSVRLLIVIVTLPLHAGSLGSRWPTGHFRFRSGRGETATTATGLRQRATVDADPYPTSDGTGAQTRDENWPSFVTHEP